MYIAAKPRVWGKYTYRSQLEARWAFFFDFLGIRYRYEPKLFFLRPGLWYRPDFWLMDYFSFFEVKGEKPVTREKMRLLARVSRINVYTFFGDVGAPDQERDRGAFLDHGDDHYFTCDSRPRPVRIRYPMVRPGQRVTQEQPHLRNAYGRWGRDYGWQECLDCGMLALATADPTICWQCACPQPLNAPHTATSPRLLQAYRAANQYRFQQPQGDLLVQKAS